MMKKYIRNVIQIFSMVFTSILLVNFLSGKVLTNSFVTSICFVAFIAAALSIIFYDIAPFNKLMPFLSQVIYVVCIVASVDFILVREFGHQPGMGVLMGNFLLILIIYGVVRWVGFTEDKKEADEINQVLKKMREGK